MDTKTLFIISGPSGSGQDSIIEGLGKIFPLERVVTSTTRTPRPTESEGTPYYFLSREVFETGIATGDFIEWAQEYNDQLYGVTRQELDRVVTSGKIGIWKIEWKGVITAKKLFPGIKTILISAPIDSIEKRIRDRDHPTDAYLAERVTYTREWLRHTDIYDYTIENLDGRLEEAINQVADIIRNETGTR